MNRLLAGSVLSGVISGLVAHFTVTTVTSGAISEAVKVLHLWPVVVVSTLIASIFYALSGDNLKRFAVAIGLAGVAILNGVFRSDVVLGGVFETTAVWFVANAWFAAWFAGLTLNAATSSTS
jgi:hypothetical protein